MNTERKQVLVKEEVISGYTIGDRSLKEVRHYIDRLINQFGEDTYMSWTPNYYYPYEREPSPSFVIKTHRMENDVEYEKRLREEEEMRKRNEDRERETLARLQEKYGVAK